MRRFSTIPREAAAFTRSITSVTWCPSSSGCRSSRRDGFICRGSAGSGRDAGCRCTRPRSGNLGCSSATRGASGTGRGATGGAAPTFWSTSRTTPGTAARRAPTSTRATSCCGRSSPEWASPARRTTASRSSSIPWAERTPRPGSKPKRAWPIGCAPATGSRCPCAWGIGWGCWWWWRPSGSPACSWPTNGGRGACREIADCGFRIADWPASDPPAPNPQSTIRNPQLGGEAVMRVGVDVGGTVTDLVALGEDGTISVRKVVTTPEDPAVGMFRALDADPRPIAVLIHGTTIATNALLERTGARVVLVTTGGFEDLLWLRRQDRAALYDLARDHPPPLVARGDVVPVAERMGPGGVLEPLREDEVRRIVAAVRGLAPEAVAVSLLFAFRHAEHERTIAAALRDALPAVPVAASHEVLPAFREFERTSTTTLEAYLRPKVATYLGRLERDVRGRGIAALRVMASSGGTLPPAAAAARAASLALSGPAGGVVGARSVGAALGLSELLTLDMGGTSADASLVTGGAPVSDGGTGGGVAGIPLALPAVLIETVSAGGGSIARVDAGGALKVGPESAGAVPGPACYGRGGERPTVTDACLVLGWLDAARPLADEVRLDPGAAERAIRSLGAAAGGDPSRGAAGIVAVAAAVMARALKRVSVARGLDPRRMALLPFGGAGPLFGCRLADALGMRTIVIPPHPGALSALGLAAAAERVDLLASLHRPLDDLQATEIGRAFSPLLTEGARQVPGGALWRYADCRFAGQGYEVTVPVTADEPQRMRDAFLVEHRARFGPAGSDQTIELVNQRVVALREGPVPRFHGANGAARGCGAQRSITLGGAGGDGVAASVWALDELAAGVTIDGPAILAGRDATALLEPGWRGTVHRSGAVVAERR